MAVANSAEMPTCHQCGTKLEPDCPAGLCSPCLIQGAFDTSLSESGTQILDPHPIAGDHDFGRYDILRSLGEGGMGTVYLAEQREPIRRYVALKVVKLGMDTSEVLARFANERQALAVMDHPNIARILDAGATPKGRPYFVMEYIEGLPITRYCDQHRMTIGQRLELFLAVCRAVQHAHEKRVIHRDLKPSNVLVMDQNEGAVPKVIDFGIAKATDKWAVEHTLLTEIGQMVGTPEYASPEQAEVVTGDVNERSDVYSLGVILYELLIGTVPYESARMRRAGLSELLRIIREEEAPALSRKLTAMGSASAGIASCRQTDPATLRRMVHGDLNNIAMKALEKVQTRRYSSVAEFAADIYRHIDHRPVLASPPSQLYRARKFIRRNRAPAFGASVGFAFILLGGVTVWSFMRHEPPPAANPQQARSTDGNTIVLADFANATGDAVSDGTLRQIAEAALGNSGNFSLLSDARVRQTLHLMERPTDSRLTPEIASEVCERAGGAAAVEGSATRLGNQYLLGLRARNCRTGDVLDQEQGSAAQRESVPTVLGQMIGRLRARALESLPRVERVPGLSIEATTPSLEAWKSYSAAMKAQQRKGAGTSEAVSLLKRAVEIDPKFAIAYAFLGRVDAALGESELGARNIARAYELRNGVSDRENYFITFNYHRQVTRNLELARQTLESWTQKDPRELLAHGFLAAFTTQGSGHYEKAAEEGQKAVELDPDYSIGYENTAVAYIYMNRLPEAEAVLQRATERGIEVIQFSLDRYFIDFLKGDQAGMEKESTQRQAKFDSQGEFEHQEALTMAYYGRLKEANRLSDRAVSLSRQAGLRERAAQFEGARAAWNALFENRTEVKASAVQAMSLHRSRDADYGPAFALALLGQSPQAHIIEADLARQYPEDTSVQFSYLPVLRALAALNQGDPSKALELTQVATPYDLAVPATAFYDGAFFGALYPVYVRGLAYSQMSRPADAAAEFQKIIYHPGIMLNDPAGPMARLQLARALSASGNFAKSAAEYRDLLNLWRNADPDNRMFQQAKAESVR